MLTQKKFLLVLLTASTFVQKCIQTVAQINSTKSKDLKNLLNKCIFQKFVQSKGPTRPINAAPRKDDDNEGKDGLFSSRIFSSKQINAVSFEA